MTFDKYTRERLLAHCGELHEDDAVDPRDFFKPPRSTRMLNRKTLQLCSQVAETLALVFAGELGDELLQGLRIESVDPAPDASQLAVTLRLPAIGNADPRQVMERLDKAKGRLRCEVAAAITRKRAPKLVFRLIGGA